MIYLGSGLENASLSLEFLGIYEAVFHLKQMCIDDKLQIMGDPEGATIHCCVKCADSILFCWLHSFRGGTLVDRAI